MTRKAKWATVLSKGGMRFAFPPYGPGWRAAMCRISRWNDSEGGVGYGPQKGGMRFAFPPYGPLKVYNANKNQLSLLLF